MCLNQPKELPSRLLAINPSISSSAAMIDKNIPDFLSILICIGILYFTDAS